MKQTKEDIFFNENDDKVNATVAKGLAYVFWVIPILFVLRFCGVFVFSKASMIFIGVIGTFTTIGPYIFYKMKLKRVFIKSYILIALVIFISALGSQVHVGIYITWMLAPLVSCMYFDRKLTSYTVLFSYISFLISFYFRAMQMSELLYNGAAVLAVYKPFVAGYTIEYITMFVFFYMITDRTRMLLIQQKRLSDDIVRKEARIRIAVENSNDIIAEYDVANDTYQANGSFFTDSRDDITVENCMEFLREKEFVNANSFDMICEILHGGVDDSDEHELNLSTIEDGKVNERWISYVLNIMYDEDGNIINIIGRIRNITSAKLF